MEEQRKEFSDGSGLEWSDFGARMYDNQIGRLFSVDPMAESFSSASPYQFTLNNPISNIDYGGMFSVHVTAEFIEQQGVKDLGRLIDKLYTLMDNIETTIKENDVIRKELVSTTGLSEKQILKDAKSGSGPQLIFDKQNPGEFFREDQSVSENSITLAGLPFAGLSNVDKDKDQEEYSIQTYGAIMYALHEYGHLGDKKTNNRKTSGQKDDPYGLPKSTDKSGRQRPFANTGHRGDDVETAMLGVWRKSELIYDPDGTLNSKTREQIKNAVQFNNLKSKYK